VTFPPPFLATEPLGPTPTLAPDGSRAGHGEDPIASVYDRPPAGTPSEAPGLPIGPDEVSAFLVGVSDVLAQLRGPHWHVEPDELGILAPPLARQLAQPDSALAAWLAAHADGVLIAFGAAAVVIPRAIVEYQVIRWRRQQAERGEATLTSEVPIYGVPDYGAGIAPGGDRAAADGTGPGLPSGIEAGSAAARPSDPERLAASLGGLAGR